ncbi:MAG TPA: response regulator [Candidatus Thermoplasmatota archaeon]|nr:response regulator [Candidatus Thermoplasmatota archaeon]
MSVTIQDASHVDPRPTKNVLVIDDVPEIGQMYRALLRRVRTANVRATIEVQSARAIELLEREPFDLVITDFRMPGYNGADVVRAVRRTQPNARCILMSGYLESSAGKLPEDGVDAVVAKPLNSAAIIALIERVLADERPPRPSGAPQ